MENEEIMENGNFENEETTYEEIGYSEETTKNRGPVIAIAAVGAAALAGAGVLAYKKLIKPNAEKVKNAITDQMAKRKSDRLNKEYIVVKEENEE